MTSKEINEDSNNVKTLLQKSEFHENTILQNDSFSPQTNNRDGSHFTTLASTTPAASTFTETTTISPGKKNKRKMAEPRRRITDFSIRNICSESTSCSSFASEIESDTLLEKRSRLEELGQERSDNFLAFSSCSADRNFLNLKEGAPLDVLVSLSLLTQHHNHQLHQLTQSPSVHSSPVDNIPSKMSPKQSSQQSSQQSSEQPKNKITEQRSFTSEKYRDNDLDDDERNEKFNFTKDNIASDFSLRSKNKLVDKVEISETSKLQYYTSMSSSDVSEEIKAHEEVLLRKFKSERDTESMEINDDLLSEGSKQGSDRSSLNRSSDQLDNSNKRESIQQQHKTSFVNTFSSSEMSRNSINNNNNAGIHQRKNYKNMTKQRRIEANARERTRVHTISAAFESLRKAVPSYSHNQRLSKLAILRIACSYILALVKLAELEDYESSGVTPPRSSTSSPDSMTFSQCVDLCTQTIQSEGKTKRRH